MLGIEKHIASLLEENSCVIIPSFGGFLINHKSAYYLEDYQQFHPPSAQIGFNKNLDNNDGLLIQRLATHEGLSYTQAELKIQDFVTRAKQSLRENRSVVLKGIGKLYLDAEDHVQFAQHAIDNYRQDSFGLPVLETKSIPVAVEQSAAKTIPLPKKEYILPYRIAGVIALLLTASLFLLLEGDMLKLDSSDHTASIGNFEVDLGEREETDGNSVLEAEEESTTDGFDPFAEENTSLLDDVQPEKVNSDTTNDLVTDIEEKQPTPVVQAVTPVIETREQYHIVIGMFVERENAFKAQTRAKDQGYNADIIHGVKYNRVVIAFDKDNEPIRSNLLEIRSRIEPNAWVWESRNR